MSEQGGVNESVLGAKLDALGKSMDGGFRQVNQRLTGIEGDVKELREEGLPRRVRKLEDDADAAREAGLPRRVKSVEDWRDTIRKWWWAFASSGLLVLLGAWVGVVIGGG